MRALGVSASLLLTGVMVLAGAQRVDAQELRHSKPPDAENGGRLFKSGCTSCHGADGTGAPETLTAFARPSTFPDFTQCDQTTAEPDATWKDIIEHGGPSRGFSQIMPAFEGELTPDQIDDLVAHLRTLCRNSHWPRGELNLPRALVTEKAYPEDELVLSSSTASSGSGFAMHVVHEQRFGVKNQIEVDLPIQFQVENNSWVGGLGDMTLALKRVMYSNLSTGSIVAVQGGVLPPTGSTKHGFGSGTTTFETFAAVDQLFPTNTWIQFQAGVGLPVHTDIAPQSLFWNTAVGQTFSGDQRLGRLWSPIIEVLAARDLQSGARTTWDVMPEMQVTLSRRQHVRINAGVRTPVANTAGRHPQAVAYVLWDWADGKLLEGWK